VSDPLDALAAEHGAVSTAADLDALASEHGAVRPRTSSPNKALTLAAAGQSIPAAATAAMEFATNPGVPRAGSIVGQVVGGVQGAMRSPLDAAGGAWAGGKAGWFTGKLSQKLAAPVARVLDAAKPYAQTLTTLAAAQGVNDLAQMAEPNRRDIGFLGLGFGTPDPKDPAMVNDVIDRVRQKLSPSPDVAMLTAAVKKGANATQAAAQLTNGDPRKFAELLTAYSRSLGQGR